MTDEELQEYKRIRPYLRSVIALAIYIRFGGPLEPGKLLPAQAMVVADEFLTLFEQNRS